MKESIVVMTIALGERFYVCLIFKQIFFLTLKQTYRVNWTKHYKKKRILNEEREN